MIYFVQNNEVKDDDFRIVFSCFALDANFTCYGGYYNAVEIRMDAGRRLSYEYFLN